MLKNLVIAAVILAGTQKPLPMNRGQQQEQSQADTSAAQPIPPAFAVSDVDKENTANAERYAYYKAHPKEYLKAALAPANASNWILAALGIFGGVLALHTLSTIKAQTSHIMTTGRPWMTAQMMGNPQMQAGFGLVGGICKLTNCGQSIAYVIEMGNAIDVLEKGASLPDKFPEFDKDNFRRWDGDGIPIFPEGKFPRSAMKETGNKRIAQSIMAGEQVVWFYGYIRYRDAFMGKRILRRNSPWRETRFCFKWQTPNPEFGIEGTFTVEGPPAYIQAS